MSQSRCGHFRGDKWFLSPPAAKQDFLLCPVRSLATVPTELPGYPYFCRMRYIIFLPSTSTFIKCSLPLSYSDQSSVCIYLPCVLHATPIILLDLMAVMLLGAGVSGRTVYGLGLWPLASWDCGFESHQGHGCLSVVSVVCCQVEVSASGWSLVQRSPTYCDVSECDL